TYHDQSLLVNDGSTDGTAKLLETLRDGEQNQGQIQLLRHHVNHGYGRSNINSFDYADRNGYDWVITMDCDEQHEPEMIPVLMQHIAADRCDVISGSRYLENRLDNDLPPGDRRAINATITSTLNDLFHFGITDAFCG